MITTERLEKNIVDNALLKRQIKKGDKFNRRTFLGDIKKKGKKYYYKCICNCGSIKYVERYQLTSGSSKSCGCLQKEIASNVCRNNFTIHGLRKDPIYRKYTKMKERCDNENYQYYKDYGGRGIKCERESFESFYNDMNESFKQHVKIYGLKNTTLDRIDVNKNYNKYNCKRSTFKEQASNRTNNRILLYKGKKYTLSDLAKKVGLNRKTLSDRLNRLRDINRACEEPVHKEFKPKTHW